MAEENVAGGAPRPALSAERVLREALRLAGKEGLDAVSMRRLGRELGAGTMWLCHYVASRDDLLVLYLRFRNRSRASRITFSPNANSFVWS